MLVLERAASLQQKYYPITPERRFIMMSHVMRFVRDEEGATALEYGLLAALIAAAMVTAVTAVGTNLGTTLTSVAGDIDLAS